MGPMEAGLRKDPLHRISPSWRKGGVVAVALGLLISGAADAQWGGDDSARHPPPSFEGSSRGETVWDWNGRRFRPEEGGAPWGEGRSVNPWQNPGHSAPEGGGAGAGTRPWGELPPEARGREGSEGFPPPRQPGEWRGDSTGRWQGSHPRPYPPAGYGAMPWYPPPRTTPYPPGWGGEGIYMPFMPW